jgi:hypothetical protein
MSYQKHKVTTDALDTLGTIIDDTQKRDAIHLAVIPVQAGCSLTAGTHVGLLDGKAHVSSACDADLGIVDPFLSSIVRKGQWFWLMIHPRVITSLRHVWVHPDIPDEAGTAVSPSSIEALKELAKNREYAASEAWLRNWCRQSGEISYDDLIAVAVDGEVVRGGEDLEYYGGCRWALTDYGLMSYGADAYASIPPELWDHVKVVTGVEPAHRPDSLGCSC